MDFWEVIKKRHCTRSFDADREVSDEIINKLIEAAKMAPTAGNMQDWSFNIIKDKETKEKLVQAALGQKFINEAPIVIVISSDLDVARKHYGDRGVNLYSIQDVAVAAENLFLACTALELSTCWVGAFNEDEVKEILNLSENLRPMVILPIGYKK